MKSVIQTRGILGLATALLVGMAAAVQGADDKLELLKTRTATYTNVTVTSKGRAAVFITHDGGVANLKLQDIETDDLERLGYVVPKKAEPSTNAAPAIVTKVMESLSITNLPLQGLSSANGKPDVAKLMNDLHIDRSLVIGVLAGVLFTYLFACYCFMCICKKTGNEPGILVWLPILQAFPLLRAAGMSGWWFLAFLIPGVSILAHIVWCIKIVEARAKSGWWALLLILPFTNVLAFLYLAFSRGVSPNRDSRVAFPNYRTA